MSSLDTICGKGAGNTTKMPNGNLATPTTPAPTQKLIYNAQGQLAELRDANNVVIATYVYRGDGKRAWKELANGTRSYFYYAGEMLIAGSNGNDASGLQLWGADGLVGSRSFNSTTGVTSKSYNLYDPQGNLVQTLDAATGNVTGQSAVSAWGEPIRDAAGNSSGGGYGAKFGYIRDGESGFYLCTLRYYDPSAGRWITRDPTGYNGGSNLYGYVGNDPVNAIDPSGLAPAVTVVLPNPKTGVMDYIPLGTNGKPMLMPRGVKPMSNASSAYLNGYAGMVGIIGMILEHNPTKAGAWFYEKVRNHKKDMKAGKGCGWDYKQLDPRFADFGNFNYGLTGRAYGIPLKVLLKKAGEAQIAATPHNHGPGYPGQIYNPLSGKAPYGDNPEDQVMITAGANYFDQWFDNRASKDPWIVPKDR